MNTDVLKIFIGYDPVESVSWHAMVHSILEKSSKPIAVIPVNIANFKNLYSRERDGDQSNEFSFARFLAPYLSGYSGLAAYFDCDMLLRTDISDLFNIADSADDFAVYVVKHDYVPKDKIKYLNTVQHSYPRKNWSSVILWNCGHPSNKVVTPEYVSKATPKELHRFLWLKDEEIGQLDERWNWLVGEYPNPPDDVKNVHWTIGGPYFNEYRDADFAEEWFAVNKRANYCLQRDEVV